ncbi:sensor histidine kinase [Streptomyces venezuelae]|uniref:sensor histidine kinase n=1 Tax=Streptomyces venezuelae TaxID=54571 RepID=UPI0012390BDC|nr:HAMP domain-containing sensor histidine kinase [Streptomyces venezuelae]
MRGSSLRARAALAAALAMAALLAAGGLWLHHLLRANLLDNTASRTELAARKAAAQADAHALPADGRLPAPDAGVDLVLVLDAHGRTLAAGGNTRAVAPAELAGVRPPPGTDSRTVILPADRPGGERRGVVLVEAQGAGPGERVTVYAMTVLGDVDDATRAIALGLLAGAPPLIGFAALLAWWVTGQALRPVTAIRSGLAAVTASRLDRRVPDPGGADEIARLARTVNDTLDRLERSDARQRQFTADASHELRNPLAAVRSRLEVALAGAPRPGDRPDRESVRAALAETDRLQRIAADLLLLARLDGGADGAAGEPVDLALLAAEDAARRPVPRPRQVRLRVEAEAPVPATGRPARLERALANLVDNALRHARTEVVVRAYAAAPGTAAATAVLEVRDDGPGIPAADRDRVFERFVRLDEDRGRTGGGTGLGLPIAREIARAHGGEVTAGEAPGGGTRLVLRLPAHRPRP